MDHARPLFPFQGEKPLIGMVHLLPLPGTMYHDSFDAVIDSALADAVNLLTAGFDGLIIENYGDIPFRKDRVEPHTIAAMTAVAWEIRREVELPIGINVLRNDPFGAVAVASAVGASFIRVNVLSGTMVTDQGIIEGRAAELVTYIDRIAPDLMIFADVNVKHARPLVERPIEEMAQETMVRGGANALIVTGTQTGGAVDTRELKRVRQSVVGPILIGSGVSDENILELLPLCDGMIIGSSLMVDGRAGMPVDLERASLLVAIAKG